MRITSVNLGQYAPSDSFIHRLDPRAKFFSVLMAVTAVFPSRNILVVSAWAVVLFVLVKASKIPIRSLLASIKPVMFLALFTFFFNIVFAGLHAAFFTSSRLIVIMLFALMLPLTTSPLELADGLGALLRPLERFNFPADDCAMMMGISLRFIPLLSEEIDRITRAQLSRGARLEEGNIFRRIKAFLPILIPLMIIIFRRTDEIAAAMDSRGYKSGKRRTRRKPLAWKKSDTFAVIVSAAAMIGAMI